MGQEISRQVKWFVVIAAVITIILLNIIVLTAPDNNQYHPEIPNRQKWFTSDGMIIKDCNQIYPVISYDNNSGEFRILNKEKCNEKVFVGNLFSRNISYPEYFEDLWHTPDLSVEGNNLSLDYSIYDGTGIDCGHAIFKTKLKAYKIKSGCIHHSNWIEGPDIDYDNGFCVSSGIIEVSDLKAGEYREYRITTDLFEPNPGESYLLELSVYNPEEFTDTNNISYKIDQICPDCGSWQKSQMNLVLNTSDGFNMPDERYIIF